MYSHGMHGHVRWPSLSRTYSLSLSVFVCGDGQCRCGRECDSHAAQDDTGDAGHAHRVEPAGRATGTYSDSLPPYMCFSMCVRMAVAVCVGSLAGVRAASFVLVDGWMDAAG
jgi:hypothetical protein